jgi:FMN reductase (NADPH)/FMN reductase [NAD(P)H]
MTDQPGNAAMALLMGRKSVRDYTDQPISASVKDQILQAALRAPTAGNQMLYTIIEVQDAALKTRLAVTCDNQPFIAKAPLVLLFLADDQRWEDYYTASGVDELCARLGKERRRPGEGDLFLACCDALIAAQTAVVAAEALGIGSCYIGDILENYEEHRALFNLPDYAVPIALVCFGYPTEEQQAREQSPRFDQRFVFFENGYQRLSDTDFAEMYRERAARWLQRGTKADDIENFGQLMYLRKFAAAYSHEMNRSAHVMVQSWLKAGAAELTEK